MEKQILTLTNQERAKDGLKTLSGEPNLSTIARFHSEDMAKRNYFSHIDPDKKGPFDRVAKMHRRFIGTGGENIVMITKTVPDPSTLARYMVDEWMGSPGHRANILNDEDALLGVGCAEVQCQVKNGSFTKIYATQVFGNVVGYLREDFPSEITADQQVDIVVVCTKNGLLPPSKGNVVELGQTEGALFKLNPMGEDETTSGGKLIMPERSGIYQLVFQFPLNKQSDPQILEVVPGPIFIVKEEMSPGVWNMVQPLQKFFIWFHSGIEIPLLKKWKTQPLMNVPMS
ncbi:MAG: CAP domain-containing protein [Candidatus Omnitrophota bacterium]